MKIEFHWAINFFNTIYFYLKRGVFIEYDIYNIYNRYMNGESVVNLAKEYGVHHNKIYTDFKKHQLKVRDNRTKSLKYTCDEHYFDIIDTQDKAYWLGYIYADGYITSNMRYVGMSLSKKDEYILYNLNEDLSSTYPINQYSVSKGYKIGSEYSRLLICNPTLVNGLYNNGVMPHKTNTLMPPNLNDELIRHFIRGYFDGDGCVTISKGIGDVEVLSTEPILDFIQNNLYTNNIIDRYYPYSKRKPHQIVSRFRFGKTQSIINFFHYIYDDSNRKLERKYNKFIEIFKVKNILY